MRLGPALVLTSLTMTAGGARAEEAPLRSIWLECAAPKSWPANRGAPIRLSCRLGSQTATGPAYWETVNPFVQPDRRGQLMDPFAVEATARSVDLVEKGRPIRLRSTVVPLADSFAAQGGELLNPFEPSRYEAELDDAPPARC